MAMFENFTAISIKAIAIAMDQAATFGHEKLDTDLLLLGIASTECIGSKALRAQNFQTADIGRFIAFEVGKPRIEIPFKPKCKGVFAKAQLLAKEMGHSKVTTGHLLLSMILSPDCDGAKILDAIKSRSLPALEKEIRTLLGEMMTDPQVEHIEHTIRSREERLRHFAEIAKSIPDWEDQLKNILKMNQMSEAEIRAEMRRLD